MDGLITLTNDLYYSKFATLFKTKILLSTLQILGTALRGSSTDIFICKVRCSVAVLLFTSYNSDVAVKSQLILIFDIIRGPW